MTTAQIDSALWYLGRGTGVVALVAFTVTLLLGILTRSGRPLPGLPRFAVAEIHRSTSLVATTLLVVHIVTLSLDSEAQIRLVDAVVPFTGAWRPFWVGLGALAVDATIALVVTSLLRDRLPVRAWRAVHWTAYAMWPLAFAHALGTGTDAGSRWFLAVALTCAAAVAGALVWRLSVVAGEARSGSFAGGFFDTSGRVAGSRRPMPTPTASTSTAPTRQEIFR